MPTRHQHLVKVRFYELDPYGHLNHSVYVQLFETGRIELLESVGLGLPDLEKKDYRLVVSHIETKFLSPAISGNVVLIQTGVIEERRASLLWEHQMIREDTVLSTQKVLTAITDTEGKLIRLPEFVVKALIPYTIHENKANSQWLTDD